MLLKNRVIWSDNGTLKDVSDLLNNHISGTQTLPIVAAEDYIYLGSEAPFNHRWIEVGTVNTADCRITVALWDGATWRNAVETIDLTLNSAGTKTLSESGILAWVPDKNLPTWSRDDTRDTSSNIITGLGNVTIYNLYWARLQFSADLLAGTTIGFIGHKFANDEDLYSLYPEFNTSEAKTRFKTGLTTFDQVHFEAAKAVIRDLKSQDVITSGNQLLEWETFRIPAIHKAAELIYNAYGLDYDEDRKLARTNYKEGLNVDLFNVDVNENASLDIKELSFRTGRMLR